MPSQDDGPEGRPLPDDRRLAPLPPGDLECDACDGTGRVTEPIPQYGGRYRYHLERGWKKRWLIIQLALGELGKGEIARTVRAHPQSVRDFERKHAAEIAEAAQHLEDEFVALWVVDKANRLAEYQQDIDDANEIIASEMGTAGQPAEQDPLDPGGENEEEASVSSAPVWVRLKHQALRAVAEELGQIPNKVRMDIGGRVATYRIEGVDLDQV